MISVDFTLVIQFINLIVLMVALNMFLFRPIRAVMAARKDEIEGGQLRADELQESIESRMAEYDEKLKQARMTAGDARTKLKSEGQAEETTILSAAYEEASASLASIKESVTAEKNKVRDALKKETEEMAKMVSSSVLGRSL